jgi:hypothetical protein
VILASTSGAGAGFLMSEEKRARGSDIPLRRLVSLKPVAAVFFLTKDREL